MSIKIKKLQPFPQNHVIIVMETLKKITFKCPYCGNILITTEAEKEIKGVCPYCDNTILAPVTKNAS